MFNLTDDGIFYFGEIPEENVLQQIRNSTIDKRCLKAGLCADNHLGYSLACGGVVAYKDVISPSGVGYSGFMDAMKKSGYTIK